VAPATYLRALFTTLKFFVTKKRLGWDKPLSKDVYLRCVPEIIDKVSE
jgi:hypothetical protein